MVDRAGMMPEVASSECGSPDVPFDSLELAELPHVISSPRFATHLQATNGVKETALELYEWNLRLSSAFMIPLQVCEVATRNGVADALTRVHGENWPWSNGFRRSLPRPRRERDYDPKTDLEIVAARQPTTGKIVADLKFVFWEKLFTVGQDERLWNPHFRDCFPGAPAELSISEARARAFSDMQSIRRLRNRIAHHEPIFSRAVFEDYRRIVSMISWRSRTAAGWVERIQGVTEIIPLIPAIG